MADQYKKWQPKLKCKQALDPTLDDVKRICCSMRRRAKDEPVRDATQLTFCLSNVQKTIFYDSRLRPICNYTDTRSDRHIQMRLCDWLLEQQLHNRISVLAACLHWTPAHPATARQVLFHYNGLGVPRPTQNGELWVFNRTYTQYLPLSVYDLQVRSFA